MLRRMWTGPVPTFCLSHRKDWLWFAKRAFVCACPAGRAGRHDAREPRCRKANGGVAVVAAGAAGTATEAIMPNSTAPKLNDLELVILSSAAQRQDGLAVLPEGANAAAVAKAATKLTRLGYVKAVGAKHDQPLWSTGEDGKLGGLKITHAGADAIGVTEDVSGDEATAPPARSGQRRHRPEPPKGRRSAQVQEPRGGSKRSQIVALMQRKSGATLDDLVGATGWLLHTTRAALTGLRHSGYELSKSKNKSGKTAYRITQAGA